MGEKVDPLHLRGSLEFQRFLMDVASEGGTTVSTAGCVQWRENTPAAGETVQDVWSKLIEQCGI